MPGILTTVSVSALIIFGAFLVMQTIVYRKSCRRIDGLSASFAEALGSGNAALLESSNPWIRWVISTVGTESDGSFEINRNDALGEFDRVLADDEHLSALQRMSIGAPLLGVIFTAVGFWLFKEPPDTDKFTDIIGAVVPLVTGVGLGAFLALWNQYLLWKIDSRVGSLRTFARNWFDMKIWANRANPLDQTVASLVDVSKSLRATSVDQQLGVLSMREVSVMMQQTAEAFRSSLTTFVTELKGLPQNLPRLGESIEVTVKRLYEVLPRYEFAASSFVDSVATFRQTSEDSLARTAMHQQATSADIAHSARDLQCVIATLNANSTTVGNAISELTKGADDFNALIKSCFIPHQELMEHFAARIDIASNDLVTGLQKVQASFEAAGLQASKSEDAFSLLANASIQLKSIMDSVFAPAAKRFDETTEGLAAIVARTTGLAESMNSSAANLENASLDTVKWSTSLKQSVEGAVIPAHKLLAKASENFDRTAESMHAYIARFDASLQSMATSYRDLLENLSAVLPKDISLSFNRFSQIIADDFGPAAAKQVQSTNRFAQSFERFEMTVEEFHRAMQALNGTAQMTEEIHSKSSESLDLMKRALTELGLGATAMHDSVVAHAIPSQKELHEYATAVRQSAVQLGDVVNRGLVPVVEKLLRLDTSIDNINAALTSIQKISSNGTEFRDLTTALDKMREATKSIGESIGPKRKGFWLFGRK